MNDKQLKDYNNMVDRINAIPPEELDRLINNNKCPFEPEHLIGEPIGMFHCNICGEMVLAGVPHPRDVSDADIEALQRMAGIHD